MELTLKQKTAFGIGAVGKDMVYALSASYVMYYYQDVLGLSASFVGVVLMAARFFDAFNDPFMGVLVAKTRTRWGRFRPWIFSGTLLVFCLTGLSHSLALLCIPGVVVFACNGMLTVLTTLFLSNSVDYGQLKTGRREESVIFSMQTFVVKAASGVAVFLTGIGLDLIGLVGNMEETGPVAVQSAGTLLGLRLMMTVLPMLVLAGALVLFRRKFVLTDARAAEISAQLHGEETHHD